jgi:hypothetical protein
MNAVVSPNSNTPLAASIAPSICQDGGNTSPDSPRVVTMVFPLTCFAQDITLICVMEDLDGSLLQRT